MRVKTIALRYANVFILAYGKRGILVDAGLSGDGPEIVRAIENTRLKIEYIIISHAHYDHAGSLAHVQAALQVPVIASAYEALHLRRGKTSILVPQGTTMAELVKTLGLSDKDTRGFEATDAEYFTFEEAFNLSDIGFEGYVKVLPGHTPGSVCVFTPKDIICGDTVFNLTDTNFPPIYSDKAALLETFRTIKNSGCRYIYPAHGKRLKTTDLKLD